MFRNAASFSINLRELLRITAYFDGVLLILRECPGDIQFLPIILTEDPNIARDCITGAVAGQDMSETSEEHGKFWATYELHPFTVFPNEISSDSDTFFEDDDEPMPDVSQREFIRHPYSRDHLEVTHIPIDTSQTTTNQNGRILRRRYVSDAGMAYYYCIDKGCKGSIAVNKAGRIRTIKPHSCVCVDTRYGLSDWESFAEALCSRISTQKDESPYTVLREVISECKEWEHIAYTTPPTVLDRLILDKKVGKMNLVQSPFDGCTSADDFVQYHSCGRNPLLILATPFMLEEAKNVSWLLIDGTFNASPKTFKQLLTFLGEDINTGRFTPLAYMLLPNKEKETYHYAFAMLSTIIHFPRVELVSCDYEDALRQEVEIWMSLEEMPSKFFGCKFHFSQCLFRKLRNNVSAEEMRWSGNQLFHIFCGFVYLTKDEVERCLRKLDERKHPYSEFVEYFRTQWIPRFDIWNLSEVDEYTFSRSTNNAIESFNASVNSIFGKHPRIDRFISGMKKLSLAKQREIELGFEREERTREFPEPREIIWRLEQWLNEYEKIRK